MNGLRAGYVSGKELTDTMDKKKEAENARFKSLDDSTTGRVAETVYRGKDGKKVCSMSGRNCSSRAGVGGRGGRGGRGGE